MAKIYIKNRLDPIWCDASSADIKVFCQEAQAEIVTLYVKDLRGKDIIIIADQIQYITD